MAEEGAGERSSDGNPGDEQRQPGTSAANFTFDVLPGEFSSSALSQIREQAEYSDGENHLGGDGRNFAGRTASHQAASPSESINSNRDVQTSRQNWSPLSAPTTRSSETSPSYTLNSRTPTGVGHGSPDTHLRSKSDPQRMLAFPPQAPLRHSSLPTPPPTLIVPNPPSPGSSEGGLTPGGFTPVALTPGGFTPPPRTPARSPSLGPHTFEKLRKPPLPPQTPPTRLQTPGIQSSTTSDPNRPVPFVPFAKSNLFTEPSEGPPVSFRRHSWDSSMKSPSPQRTPHSRSKKTTASESPSSGGAQTPGAGAPLRRASTASPSLSPLLRSAATSNSPPGSEELQYTPASRPKMRKSSWSEKDFGSMSGDVSSEGKRASFPWGASSPDSRSSGGVIHRVGSGEFKLTVKTGGENRALSPHSHQLDFPFDANSPKTQQARQVTSASQLRGRWKFTTVLGGFITLLVLTSLLTHFWALTIVAPQLESMAVSIREGFGAVLEAPPVQCVRDAKGGGFACYVLAPEERLRQGSGFGRGPRVRPMYKRLLAMAAHSLAELEWKPDTKGLWAEPPAANGTWVVCSDRREPGWLPPPKEGDANGYLMVSAEGGLNQQRVAVCNAVALARHLNLTLVVPDFVLQNGNYEESQFEDIFSVDHFKEYLRPDVRIVDRLPDELSEVDLEGTGSVFDDSDFPREAPLRLYEETLLPVLRTNRVVHLRQFVNRLASDPIPPDIQRLRCRVNFHALRFQPPIQAMGYLLVERMRSSSSEYDAYRSRKVSQRDYWVSAQLNEPAKNMRRHVLQSEDVVDKLRGGIARQRGELVTRGGELFERPGAEVLASGSVRGALNVSRVAEETGGDEQRQLLQKGLEGGEDDVSHLPEAVQRYMRNQKLRDERKRRQQEESTDLERRAERHLGKDETLGVLERDEGMEVVRLKTALVIDDETKGLAEKTKVGEAIGEEILVADPGKSGAVPGIKASSVKRGERLEGTVGFGGSGYGEEDKWPVRFVALHANFPAKLAAFSMCDFGGGKREREELRLLREAHFETLARWERNGKAPDPTTQRKTGQCPLTPEEAVLMLAALGVKRRTRIYLTTAEVWGGQDRLIPLKGLYPYFVTKEQLASPDELAPFQNSLPKLAALDLIVSSAADLFAMTDPGSQLSSLVTGMRMYHGRGKLPTIRPDKRQLAAALVDHKDVEWHVFVNRWSLGSFLESGVCTFKVGDSVKGFVGQTVRGDGQSVYSYPRSPECMQFEAASLVVSSSLRVGEGETKSSVIPSSERSVTSPGGDKDIEKQADKEMLEIAFHARNSTSNGTDSFGLFAASQMEEVDLSLAASSTIELERD